jgi:hypothetical protein
MQRTLANFSITHTRTGDAPPEGRRLAEALLPAALAPAACRWPTTKSGVTAGGQGRTAAPVDHRRPSVGEIILEALARVSPGIPVIAEEAVTAGRFRRSPARSFWSIRSMAPRASFRRAAYEFTINIGLIVRGPALVRAWSTRRHWPISTSRSARRGAVAARPRAACRGRQHAACSPTRFAHIPCRTRTRCAARTSQTHLNSATQRFLDSYTVVDRTRCVLLAQVRPDRQRRGGRLPATSVQPANGTPPRAMPCWLRRAAR